MKTQQIPALLLLAAAPCAFGAELTFDATVDSNILVAGNWAPDHDRLPLTGTDTGIVPDGLAATANNNVDGLSVTFQGSSSFALLGKTTALRLANSAFTFEGASSWDNTGNARENLIVGYNFTGIGDGTLTWNSSGSLTNVADLDVGRSKAGTTAAHGVLTQTDGTLNAKNLSVENDSRYHLSGGTMNIEKVVNFSEPAGATTTSYINFTTGSTGTLVVANNGNGDYTGAFQAFIDSGNIRIDGVAQTPGDYSGFGITYSAGSGETTLALAGGADPWMQVDSSFSFTTDGDGLLDQTIAVTNNGAAVALGITGVVASGPHAPLVSDISWPDSIPAAGGADDVFFNFTPTASTPGDYQFNLEISSDDASEASPRIVPVTVSVRSPLVAADTTSLDLGILANSPGAQVLTVSVTNTSFGVAAVPLEIKDTTAITGAPEFAITNTTLPLSIAPGESADIEITFDPGTGFGYFEAVLDIQSDDYPGDTPQVTLSAFVEPDADPVARIDFGTSGSPVQTGYTQFVPSDGASQTVAGVTVALNPMEGIGFEARNRGNPDDLRGDMAQTTPGAAGSHISVLLSGFTDGTLNLISSHNMAGTPYSAPQTLLFGEQGGTLAEIAAGVQREDFVELLGEPVEAGKTYELRVLETSNTNKAYISSLLMWGDAVPGGTAYGAWAAGYGLDPEWTTGDPALDGRPESDPDMDGKTNRLEFATDDDPTSPVASGKVLGKVADVGGEDVLTLTLPVRGNPLFSFDGLNDAGLVSNPVDGIICRIQGAGDLVFEGANESMVDEVVPALDAGLPPLNPGWSYRSFRTDGTTTTDPADFLRFLIEAAP